MLFQLFQNPNDFFVLIFALIFAITLHEFAHAAATTYLGDSTAKFSGRLSLNPLKHLDPLGTLFLFIAGFGWGRPVPFDPHFVKHGRWGIALIGLSGPATNFLVAFFLGAFLKTGLIHSPFTDIFLITIFVNILLGVFNLIPVPPLDGSKLLAAVLPENKQYIIQEFEQKGPLVLFGIIMIDNILNLGILSSIIGPIFNFVARLVL
ncbi:site-2 protease family protein [bacterium]|nr:site-2 protease family protein [bacterium]